MEVVGMVGAGMEGGVVAGMAAVGVVAGTEAGGMAVVGGPDMATAGMVLVILIGAGTAAVGVVAGAGVVVTGVVVGDGVVVGAVVTGVSPSRFLSDRWPSRAAYVD